MRAIGVEVMMPAVFAVLAEVPCGIALVVTPLVLLELAQILRNLLAFDQLPWSVVGRSGVPDVLMMEIVISLMMEYWIG